jgi:hypothetical protein
VFNNPFSSFHNLVAEAKEEREQLDRLLTISTPRERLLVGAVGVLLLGLAGWLFFGNVARNLAFDGVLVAPAAAAGERRSLEALVRVAPGAAPHVRAGMPATILFTGAGGAAATVDGEVRRISEVALSDELAALGTHGPVSVYRVVISLDESLAASSVAATECRIVIELGRQSPAELLGMRRS